MKIETITNESGTYQIWESDGHGKNGKGLKKTSGIQVREYISDGYLLLANYSFPVGDIAKRNAAIAKARDYIKESN